MFHLTFTKTLSVRKLFVTRDSFSFFQSIEPGETFTSEASTQVYNKSKNRYPYIFACEYNIDIPTLPSSCAAFSQAFTVNWTWWRKGPFTRAIFVAATRCNFCRAKVASSFKHVRNPCDIAATNRNENRTWFTRAILKLQLKARQKLHQVAATKIVFVNGPQRAW